MIKTQRIGWFAPSLIGLTLGIGIGSAGLLPLNARPAAIQPASPANPQERVLDANLYMQTAAEYRACCLQTYGWALERLRTRLAAVKSGELRPAVVMDLDETVVDNSAFQSFLDRERLNYSDALWERWEKDFPREVRLIPGAKGFIEAAERMGVTVVYISNRLVKHQDSTIAALKNLGLNTEGIADRILLKEQTSDKTARRKIAEQRYSVLLYFGDNLRDFSEEFVSPRLVPNDLAGQQQAIQDRAQKVEKASFRWGNDWIILPNPVYGEWQRLLGSDPRRHLRQTTMTAPPK